MTILRIARKLVMLAFLSATAVSANAADRCAITMADGKPETSTELKSGDWEPDLVADLSFGYMTSLAVSADGKRLAMGYDNGEINLWDAMTGDLVRKLKAHDKQVSALDFSPDGCALASGSVDRKIRVWDSQTGRLFKTIEGHGHVIKAVRFSAKGDSLASASIGGSVRYWRVNDGALLFMDEQRQGAVNDLAFSMDGRRFASVNAAGLVVVYGLGADSETYTIQIDGNVVANSVVFSPDSQSLAVGTVDGKVSLFEVGTGDLLHTLEPGKQATGTLAFSPDGAWFVRGASTPELVIWNVATGTEDRRISFEASDTMNVSFLPGTNELIVGSRQDKAVRVHALGGDDTRILVQSLANVPRSAVFSPDGQFIVVGYEDGGVAILDGQDGSLISRATGHDKAVNDIAFRSDGAAFASVSEDGKIGLWRMDDPSTATFFNVAAAGEMGLLSVAYSPDGARLAVGPREAPVEIRSALNGELIAEIAVDELRWNTSILFSPDGASVVVGNDEGVVKIWETEAWRIQSRNATGSGSVNDMSLSRDGRLLAAGTREGDIKFFEAGDWQSLGGISVVGNHIQAIEFASDGQAVFAGMESGDIQFRHIGEGIVNLENDRFGSVIGQLDGHTGWINSLALSPDGSKLASTSRDRTIRIWDVESGRELARLVDYKKAGFARLSGGVVHISDPAVKRQIWLRDPNGSFHNLDAKPTVYRIDN